MINQIKKINKAIKLINSWIPKTYPKVAVTIYKTSYSMIRAEANYTNRTYNDMVIWYNKYVKNQAKKKTDYIDTKYYKPKYSKINRRNKVLDYLALGSNPIFINLENTNLHTINNYVFLLLHELGHNYYKPKGKQYNEKLADLFAIRWYKKIVRV